MAAGMTKRQSRGRLLVLLVALAATLLVAAEHRFGYLTGYHIPGAPLVRSPSLALDLKQAVGLEKFYSQLGQDKWILGKVYPGVRDGYFVEIGAWDAEVDSNSKALEGRGWNGVCVEPFPRNWKNRTCRLFEEVVYSRKGETIRFRTAGELSGIDEHLGFWKGLVARAPAVELQTTTIGDVLQRAGAPRFIHYMSIDTEGSELEILKGLPFDQYRVGAFTIEHNHELPKRVQIFDLLTARGYRLARIQFVDDWYVLDAPETRVSQ
jgi:hypothetical protein